jgi:hypothetical protein
MHIDTAVMVEPRLHKYLEPVIDNMIRNLEDSTVILLFHSKINKKLLETKYNNLIDLQKIKLICMKQNNLTRVEYSDMLTSCDFWNQIDGEIILIFQTDSIILFNISQFNMLQYNDYGFVGAPSMLPPSTWQNGGLSLRRKSLMLKAICDKKKNETTWPEDKYFSVIKKHITIPAPFELAKKFSVEQFYYNEPLGIHSCWKYLSKDNFTELKKNNPEISLVFGNIL